MNVTHAGWKNQFTDADEKNLYTAEAILLEVTCKMHKVSALDKRIFLIVAQVFLLVD